MFVDRFWNVLVLRELGADDVHCQQKVVQTTTPVHQLHQSSYRADLHTHVSIIHPTDGATSETIDQLSAHTTGSPDEPV